MSVEKKQHKPSETAKAQVLGVLRRRSEQERVNRERLEAFDGQLRRLGEIERKRLELPEDVVLAWDHERAAWVAEANAKGEEAKGTARKAAAASLASQLRDVAPIQ